MIFVRFYFKPFRSIYHQDKNWKVKVVQTKHNNGNINHDIHCRRGPFGRDRWLLFGR